MENIKLSLLDFFYYKKNLKDLLTNQNVIMCKRHVKINYLYSNIAFFATQTAEIMYLIHRLIFFIPLIQFIRQRLIIKTKSFELIIFNNYYSS